MNITSVIIIRPRPIPYKVPPNKAIRRVSAPLTSTKEGKKEVNSVNKGNKKAPSKDLKTLSLLKNKKPIRANIKEQKSINKAGLISIK